MKKIIDFEVKSGGPKEVDYVELPKLPKGNTGNVVDLIPLLKKSLETKRKSGLV